MTGLKLERTSKAPPLISDDASIKLAIILFSELQGGSMMGEEEEEEEEEGGGLGLGLVGSCKRSEDEWGESKEVDIDI